MARPTGAVSIVLGAVNKQPQAQLDDFKSRAIQATGAQTQGHMYMTIWQRLLTPETRSEFEVVVIQDHSLNMRRWQVSGTVQQYEKSKSMCSWMTAFVAKACSRHSSNGLMPLTVLELALLMVQLLINTPCMPHLWLWTAGVQMGFQTKHAGLLGMVRSAFDEVQLPLHCIDAQQLTCIDANNELQMVIRDGHTLVARLAKIDERTRRMERFSTRDLHLMTGGTGGLGVLTARWLYHCGANTIVLASRSGMCSADASLEWAQLEGFIEPMVWMHCCDSGEATHMFRLATFCNGSGCVRGAWHAAGTLVDAMLPQQKSKSLAEAYSAKACSAWIMQGLCSPMALYSHVLFSSIAALLGGAGQTNYSAANSCLDLMAVYRRWIGTISVSVQWAAWAEIGMASRGAVRRRMAAKEAATGLGRIGIAQGLDALHFASLPQTQSHFAVVPGRWLNKLQGVVPTFLSNVATRTIGDADAQKIQVGQIGSPCGTRQRGDIGQHGVSFDSIIEMVQNTTGGSVDIDAPLLEAGIDSLGANELRSMIQGALGDGSLLPSTVVFDHPTARSLATYAAQVGMTINMAAPDSQLGPLQATLDMIRETIGGFVEVDEPLNETGIDSLGANELRSLMLRKIGVNASLPQTVVFDHPTVRSLAAILSNSISISSVVQKHKQLPEPRIVDRESSQSPRFKTMIEYDAKASLERWGSGDGNECIVWYNAGKGRAECIRLALSEAGIPFVNRFTPDDRVGKAQFLLHCRSLGGNLTTNVPMLTLHGIHYTQTNAILRKIGRISHLYPDEFIDRVDFLVESVHDLREVALPVAFSGWGPQGPGDAAIVHKFIDATLPLHLENFERLLGGKEFLCGLTFTIADVVLYDALFNFIERLLPTSMLFYPTLLSYVQRIAARSGISAWLESDECARTISFAPKLRHDEISRLAASWHMPASSERKIRILCAHGGGSNSEIMSHQLRHIRAAFGEDAVFTFVNGPREWKDPLDPSIPKHLLGHKVFGWYGVSRTTSATEPLSQEELANPEMKVCYSNVHDAMESLMHYIDAQGPFDVLLGFSQGATLITMLLWSGLLSPEVFVMLFSGICPRDSAHMGCDNIRNPCTLIYGKQDPLYALCDAMRKCYAAPLIYQHSGGHELPGKGESCSLAEHIRRRLRTTKN